MSDKQHPRETPSAQAVRIWTETGMTPEELVAENKELKATIHKKDNDYLESVYNLAIKNDELVEIIREAKVLLKYYGPEPLEETDPKLTRWLKRTEDFR